MPENQEVFTSVFKADISNFSSNTQELNRYISTVNSEFKAAVAGLDKWETTQDGLTAKITQLNKILDAEQRKLGNLESAYDDLVAAGKENTAEAQKLAIAINNQRAKVAQTEKDIGKYSDKLQDLQAEASEAAQEVEELSEELQDNGAEAEKTAGKFGGFLKGLAGVATAAVGVVGSFIALAESTREYRNEMAKLDTAFQTTGHSAAAAEKTYKELYGILGDEGRATEAAQQLAQLSENEEDLAANTRILTGVLGTYGDSIPTEGLAEGMAATAAMGSVQGVLADALEWHGVNLDEYNARLAEMTTTEERAAYIQETLTGLYGDAADAYAENNKTIIEANEAQADLTDATAELGAVAEPLNTILKRLGATVINGLLPYIKDLAGALSTLFSGDIAGGAEQIGGVLENLADRIVEVGTNAISKIGEMLPQALPKIAEILSAIIQKIIGYAPQLLAAAASLFLGIVQAIGPTLTALLAELPKISGAILSALESALPLILTAAQDAFMAIVRALPSVLSSLQTQLPKILQMVINFLLKNAPKLLSQAVEFLMTIVNAIPSIASQLSQNLPKIITSITSTLGANAPKIFKTAVSMLLKIADAIPEIAGVLIRNAPQMITGIVKGLAGGYKALYGVGVDMLKGLWAGMESLGDWIWKKIKGFFNNTLVGGIKKLLGISSPSKVFGELGKNSAEGYLGGFEGVMQGANKTLSRVNYAGAVGVSGGVVQNAKPAGGNTYNIYQTFEKMETTRYALHRAKVETLNALKLSEA